MKKVIILILVCFFGVIVGEYNIIGFRKKSLNLYSKTYTIIKRLTTSTIVKSISIKIEEKDYKKIKKKRDNALKKGYMIHKKKDYVSANIVFNESSFNGKIRLKGGFKDHYDDEKKWSFRVKIKNGKNIMGMESFALQNPKTRYFLNEWIFQKYIKYVGLIYLRYDFLRVILNNNDLGIYAIEESFDEALIKNNNLTLGPIIKLDKGKFILDFKDESMVGKVNWFEFSNNEYLNSQIDIYNSQQLSKDSNLKQHFKESRQLINKYRNNQIKASHIFDVYKMAKYYAAVNIFSGFHGLNWNNMRFYFNPKTSLLEPISYDSNCRLKEIISPSTPEKYLLNKYLFSDTLFFRVYMQELNKLSETENLNAFFNSIEEEIREKESILSLEYYKFNNDVEKFKRKAKKILKVVNNTFLSDVTACLDSNYITIYNSNKFPLEIISLSYKNKVVYNFKNKIIYPKLFLTTPQKIIIKIPNKKYILDEKMLKLQYKVIGEKDIKNIKIDYYICE